MINAKIMYLQKDIGGGISQTLFYAEIYHAKLGIGTSPCRPGLSIVPKADYQKFQQAILANGGISMEVDARKIAPIFIDAKRGNQAGLADKLTNFFSEI